MMKYDNWLVRRFEKKQRFSSVVGSPFVDEYLAQYDSDGNIVLKVKGKINLYEEIQSHKDSCSINIMLKRFASGDTSVLDKLKEREGMYGDFATIPKTYVEMFNASVAAQDYFNHLPVEEKQKFDNSFEKWLFRFDQDSAVDDEKVMSTSSDFSTTSGDGSGSPTPSDS